MPLAPNAARILLLDDEPFMLRLLGRLLSHVGYTQIVACTSGDEAVQQISLPGSSFDLVVLDINMPGMDGVEFIRRLVKCKFGGSIILVSGESDRILESVERLIKAHHLTSLGHLQKPVKRPEFLALLGQLAPNLGFSATARVGMQKYTVDELREAIARGELVNFYQPKVSLQTGEVVGMEALARWLHPLDGIVFPDEFIELAETANSIGALTHCVLSSAMKQVKVWHRAGYRFSVAVNVSMADMTVLDFPDVLVTMAAAADVDPELIILEVTESRVMSHFSAVLDVLSRLRLKRFRLAIDDFGTGHASLAQLRDLPFDEIKIDRGFVSGAAGNPTLRAICNASLQLARQLDLHTVAEGIETQEDWDFVRDLGCEAGQGYFIGRPMPAGNVAAWVATWQARHCTGAALQM